MRPRLASPSSPLLPPRTARRASTALALGLLACSGGEGPGSKGSDGAGAEDSAAPADSGGGEDTAPVASLAARMDIDRLLGHLDALQAIADTNAGNRSAATAGHRASLDWVEAELLAAGLSPVRQGFDITTWREVGEARLEPERGGPFVAGSDFGHLRGTPPGLASGPLVAVDVVLPPPGGENSTNSGCEAADFAAFPVGGVALLQRGGCTFSEKVEAAKAAGAVAVVIFNEGQADRSGLFGGSMDSEAGLPTLAATTALGEALIAELAAGTLQVTVEAATETSREPTENLWVDVPGARPELGVIGGHLDSVTAGPGINDNGSGTALVLELALASAARLDEGAAPHNTQRFAFWGGEELGLLGSFAYVESLTDDALALHLGNLNFDMVASPNGARFVYDGDGSAELDGYPPPEGSAALEALLTGSLDAAGLAWGPTAFDGRSDYGPFILAGVPAGGLFTGAEQRKSAAEAETYGGEAGEALDACYHQVCDTTDNIDPVLFLEMAVAAAEATEGLSEAETLGGASAARRARAPRSRLPYLGGCDAALPRW